VVTYSSTGLRKRFREMIAAHGGGHGKGFPALSYPELIRVTGPRLSLVFRTEDVWQRYNQYTETFRSSQSGFSLLASTMQAGQDSDGGEVDSEEMCALHAVIMLCFFVLASTPGESFRSTTGVYSRPSQLFISKIVYIRMLSVCCLVSSVLSCYLPLYLNLGSYARAHAHAYPHTPTRVRMRTHTCSSFKQTEHSRGDCPCRLCPVRNV